MSVSVASSAVHYCVLLLLLIVAIALSWWGGVYIEQVFAVRAFDYSDMVAQGGYDTQTAEDNIQCNEKSIIQYSNRDSPYGSIL